MGIGRRLLELCSEICCRLPRRGSRFLFSGRMLNGREVWCQGVEPRLLGRGFASGGGLREFRSSRIYMDPGNLISLRSHHIQKGYRTPLSEKNTLFKMVCSGRATTSSL
jgi:hypothetical protein